ncbi:hypothetical protein EON65_15720 [archaeon]|nr:MAG: hypothetical protein EON65_15720 [archaeon]
MFILETRKAERSITAALRFATSLANERVLSEREALLSIDARLMKQFVYPLVDPQYGKIAVFSLFVSLSIMPFYRIHRDVT